MTLASVVAFGRIPELAVSVARLGRFVPLLSLGISAVAWSIMCSSVQARRKSPLKWQLLSVFTLSEAFLVGLISSFYRWSTVVSALSATVVAVTGVSGYTILNRNSKRDLSQWGSTLASMGLVFIVLGLIRLLAPNFLPVSEGLWCVMGAGLFTAYLAYHTRLIVSGRHTEFQMNESDYVFGAMALYNDIINIFLYLLRLLDDDRRD